MSKMSGREFENAKKYIEDEFRYGNGSKEAYVSFLRGIISEYDDGYECAIELDKYNSRWSVIGSEIPAPSDHSSPINSTYNNRSHDSEEQKWESTGHKSEWIPDQMLDDGFTGTPKKDKKKKEKSRSILGTILISAFVFVLLTITGVQGFFSAFTDSDNFVMMYAFMIGMILAFILGLKGTLMDSEDKPSFALLAFIAEGIITMTGTLGVWYDAIRLNKHGIGLVIQFIVGPIIVAFAALLPALIVGLATFIVAKICKR